LAEILVAITIFGIAATAVLPLLLSGIRGGTHAKLTTQAKNLAQERLELMRNLPYYIAQQNGDYRDVLDVYFRDLANPGTVGTGDPCIARRYLSSTTSYICQLPSAVIGSATFDQVVESTFINAAGAVVTPRSGYNSQIINRDAPASSLLSVVITTRWTQGAQSRAFVLRSRIANSASDAPLITSKINGTAVKVTSTTSSGDVLQFEAGLLSADGAKSTASSANAAAVGAIASLSSGSSAKGAEVNLSAPPDDAVSPLPSASGKVLGLDCSSACFGETSIRGAAKATVSSGVPQVGIDGSTTSLGAELARSDGVGQRGFDYNNADLPTVTAALGIGALPLVSAGTGSTGPVMGTRGSVTAVDSGSTSVTSKVSTTTQAVELFPTSAAPSGLVRLSLTAASLACVDGSGRGVTASWRGEVSVHTSSGYTTYVIEPGAAALPEPATITTSTGFPLSKYVASWSGLVASTTSVAETGTPGVSGSIPSVITLLTAPTRSSDPTSVISVTVGSLSCVAEDNQ
jgi:type II secretory pathway pseudopilin PulG